MVRTEAMIGWSIVGRWIVLACVVLALRAPPARADRPQVPRAGAAADAPGPEEALDKKIAVWRFDALGIDPELVARLETLFRMELDRLDRVPLPSRRDVERAVTARERDCTGEEKCLAAIGRRLGVDVVITGTVGSLGDNYILTIKAVDVATGKSQHIPTEPLKGTPDDLIEGVRVAAYKLLAPDQLHGAVQIQSDLVGASVALDGKPIGKTPLPNGGVLRKLALGPHQLRVQAPGYDPFEKQIEVHFQKVSPVVVRLLPSNEVIGTGRTVEVERRPFYTRTWFVVAGGIAVVAIAAAIGASAAHVTCHENGMPGSPCP
jgi:hypothetical protein